MPGFDQTGPMGAGPRTGWGRGICGTPVGARRFSWGSWFRGAGRGWSPWGGGRGLRLRGRWCFPFAWTASATPTEEVEILKAEIAAAKEAVAAMEERLQELEKK